MKHNHGLVLGVAVLGGLFGASRAPAAEVQPLLKGRRALIVIAFEGFRDEEYAAVARLLGRHEAEVTVASAKVGTARGMLKAQVRVDKELSAVRAADFAAVVFIGGAGARSQLWDHPQAQRLAREAAAGQGVLAAICYAPGILAKAGVLKGRTAAAFRDRYTEAAFAEGGARLASDHVVVDGRLVTGDGPEAASPFAEAILGLLTPPARKGP